MKLRADYVKHLKVGAVLAPTVAALLFFAAHFGIPLALAVGGTGACLFVEWYQRARGNGVAEPLDLLFGALPSLVLAGGLWWGMA